MEAYHHALPSQLVHQASCFIASLQKVGHRNCQRGQKGCWPEVHAQQEISRHGEEPEGAGQRDDGREFVECVVELVLAGEEVDRSDDNELGFPSARGHSRLPITSHWQPVTRY